MQTILKFSVEIIKLHVKSKIAVTKWLKERLKLDISDEKSKITNLKNNYSEYLGLKMKVHRKGIKVYSNGRQKEKFVVKSMMSNKAVNRLINNLKMQIKTIQHSEKPKYEIAKLNQMIFGYHNYYDSATHVCKSFHIIEYKVMKCMKNRLKELKTSNGSRNKVIEKNYGESKAIKYYCGIAVIPIAYIKTRPPMQFKIKTCNYTEEGRELVHDYLKMTLSSRIADMMRISNVDNSVEYNDNRISVFSAQNGQCAITKRILRTFDFHCHHKIPKSLGGDDSYQNLIILYRPVHALIHATREETIEKWLNQLALSKDQLEKVNKLRKLCNLKEITQIEE